MCCEAREGGFVEKCFLCVPPQGLCKAPHDSGVCWKQFMMLLEEGKFWFVAVFHSSPLARPGSTKGFASV